jgi:small conductance mechanosensitive channel
MHIADLAPNSPLCERSLRTAEFLVIIQSVNNIAWQQLWPTMRSLGERLVIGAAIIAAFWLGGRIAAYLICRVRFRMPHNTGLLELLGQTTKIAMVVFGIATALGTMGINISALVAGLGLTGFALGFAFRDVLSNLLAGILLLLFRPFGVGDHISVTGLEGDVTRIDLRYTVMRQPTAIVLMPNANLFTNPILVTIKDPDKPTVAEANPGIHAGAGPATP